MRYLVTGGAGFIGSHIVERLLKNNEQVVVLDDFSSGKEENLSFVSKYVTSNDNYFLIRGDIRDYKTCLDACSNIDIIFHQAALRSVPKSMDNPYEFNDVNINGTLNMLTASRENHVKRLVFASSSSVYGDTDKFPEKEDEYPKLISPYALTKLAGEYYLRVFSENYSLETVALRYFNVFGPRQALDDEYAVVIPKFIYSILNDQKPPIYGNGLQSRDFTYVDNIVEANILASKADGVSGQVFNVANGRTHSISELVELLNKITGKNVSPEFQPVRPGDVFKTEADISKTRRYLGYNPGCNFKEGLKNTVEYTIRNNSFL